MSTAIVIYFGEWIKSVIPINLIVLLLLVYVVYIGIRCYVKKTGEKSGDIIKKNTGRCLYLPVLKMKH